MVLSDGTRAMVLYTAAYSDWAWAQTSEQLTPAVSS
jgi:hypothetical protein